MCLVFVLTGFHSFTRSFAMLYRFHVVSPKLSDSLPEGSSWHSVIKRVDDKVSIGLCRRKNISVPTRVGGQCVSKSCDICGPCALFQQLKVSSKAKSVSFFFKGLHLVADNGK